jgi:hypothetical protein
VRCGKKKKFECRKTTTVRVTRTECPATGHRRKTNISSSSSSSSGNTSSSSSNNASTAGTTISTALGHRCFRRVSVDKCRPRVGATDCAAYNRRKDIGGSGDAAAAAAAATATAASAAGSIDRFRSDFDPRSRYRRQGRVSSAFVRQPLQGARDCSLQLPRGSHIGTTLARPAHTRTASVGDCSGYSSGACPGTCGDLADKKSAVAGDFDALGTRVPKVGGYCGSGGSGVGAGVGGGGGGQRSSPT